MIYVNIMLSYTEALGLIFDNLGSIFLRSEDVDLIDSVGRYSSKEVYTNSFFPRFDNSAMDGIAVIHKSKREKWLKADTISAGNYKVLTDFNDEYCIEIMTGAKLPDEFDTVIPIEDLIVSNDSYSLRPGVSVKYGQNIRKMGEDISPDKVILEEYDKIEAKHIGILSSCGYSKLSVLSKFKIGILVTGDELIEIDKNPENDKIIASNLYTLIALVKESGMDYVSFGIIKDDKDQIKAKISEALNSDIDILITSGGVSEGKYDYIKEILEELNSKIHFWKVNVKPGKPLLFATNNNKLIFGLPGNPVAVYTSYKKFIKVILPHDEKDDYLTIGYLRDSLNKKDNKMHFVRATINANEKETNVVKLSGKQSSADIYGLSRANCLIMFYEDLNEIKKGERVQCTML